MQAMFTKLTVLKYEIYLPANLEFSRDSFEP